MTPEEMLHDGRPGTSRGSSRPAFLEGIALRRTSMPGGAPFRPRGLALGQGSSALEVLVATSDTEPALAALRSAWKARKGGRAAPLLLVVL